MPGKVQSRKGQRVETQDVKGEEWQRVDPEDMNPELQGALNKMNPKQVALFCAWVVNGRNISAAARQIGYAPSYARAMFSREKAFKEAKAYLDDIVLLEDQEWIECLPQARQTLRSLLMAKDEKVRYLAAKDIVDRAEGKATTKVDMVIRDERPSMSDEQLQLAFSIMQQTGVGFAEAQAWIRANPEQSEAWIKANVKQLPSGREITGSGPVDMRSIEEKAIDDIPEIPEASFEPGGIERASTPLLARA